MANATITLTNVCAGGEHWTFRVAVGAQNFDRVINRDDALGEITDEDKLIFLRVLLRLKKIGLTNAQVRALFENGVTV